jgi:DNA-binding MarR family transcriptional regulator/Holliday junction resolvase-like predicted endonuclease
MMYGLDLDNYQSFSSIEIDELDIITDQKMGQLFRNRFKISPAEGAFLYQATYFLKEPENYIFFEIGIPSFIDLCKRFNFNKTKLYEILKSLEEKDYLRIIHDESNRKIIYINPLLHFKRHISIDTYKLFKNKPKKRNLNISSLSEKIHQKESLLQDYLKNNLHLIEDGLTLIDTEFKLKDGRIDILARDIRNTICIIELKVVHDDEKLVFQSVYYPTQFNEKVRMITIAPMYADKIYTSLKSLQYVEIKQYELKDNELIIKNFNK